MGLVKECGVGKISAEGHTYSGLGLLNPRARGCMRGAAATRAYYMMTRMPRTYEAEDSQIGCSCRLLRMHVDRMSIGCQAEEHSLPCYQQKTAHAVGGMHVYCVHVLSHG